MYFENTLKKLFSWKTLFAILFLSIAGLRFFYCTQLPVNTGDVVRHILHGLYAGRNGLSTAGHSLVELNSSYSWVAWSSFKYNYPVVTLLFFIVVGKLSPTIFFAKFLLTLIEVLNTWLIYKYSRERLLALFYWASPISIWWVSHEGQFEPLQNFFVIIALVLLVRNKSSAFLWLALAIQVKLTAILLLPFFLLNFKIRDYKGIMRFWIFLGIGFIPTLVALFEYPVIKQVVATSGSFTYNPYYWNIFKRHMFNWNPWWLVTINQVITYGMLILLLYLMVKWKDLKGMLAPFGFIVLCKLSYLAQFWYFVLYTPFLLPIRDKRTRLWLFALTPLLDITSLIQIISGTFGYTVGEYYKTINAYMIFTI